ncbi:MAG: DNA translocase FtsK 4TM domain-containing protein [Acetivibrio ethanolgignens]
MAAKKNKKNTVETNPYRDEIILVVTLIVSVLLALSTFNLAGVFGKIINHLLFGLFGFLAYLLPYALFFGVAFAISNQGSHVARVKIFSSTGLFLILCALLQLIFGGYDKGQKLLEIYKLCAEGKKDGGLIGGIIVKALCYIFGTAGTYAILIGLTLILIMLITERLLFASIRRKRMQAKEERMIQAREREAAMASMEAPRRRAKVFTFEKEPKKEESSVTLQEPEIKEEKKAKKKTEKKTQKEEFPVYEEELKNKFHKDSTDAMEQLEIFRAEETIVSEPVRPEELKQWEEVKIEDIKQPEETVSHRKTKASEAQTQAEVEALGAEIQTQLETKKPEYVFPPLSLLSLPKGKAKGVSDSELKATAAKLQSTLESFGVKVEMKNVSCGPAVTRYELQPAQGVKVSKITSLSDDIKLSLAAADIRIEAPIPGKSAVGIEVPNKENTTVLLRTLLESKEFKNHPSDIAFAVGKDIGGNTIVTDIAKMPHLLIAGATGSGKSVCINTLIMSILYKASPEDVKLIMVDPKVVELSVYNGIPHLLIPVVTDPKKASGALNWAVMEMTERYKKFADLGVRDMKGYNERVATVEEDNDPRYQKLPQIVIIVDELADLMMVAPGEVEDAICRLAQLARAAGIHLVIATQRPSVNVITGLIKANIPSRIAFAVSSSVDSRTILDGGGAEKLLGKGDMLFFPSGYPKPVRIQGAFVSDKEVSAVVEFLSKENGAVTYNEEINNRITSVQTASEAAGGVERDEYFVEAGRFIIEKDKASIGMLQRVYKIGFNRAARIMDQLSDAGVVGPEEGTKPRKVLMSMEEFEQYVDEYV